MRLGLVIRLQQISASAFYSNSIRPRLVFMARSAPPNLASTSPASDPPNYETWTRDELIARLKALTEPPPPPPPDSPPISPKEKKKSKEKRTFDFSAYPTRKIALKFS